MSSRSRARLLRLMQPSTSTMMLIVGCEESEIWRYRPQWWRHFRTQQAASSWKKRRRNVFVIMQASCRSAMRKGWTPGWSTRHGFSKPHYHWRGAYIDPQIKCTAAAREKTKWRSRWEDKNWWMGGFTFLEGQNLGTQCSRPAVALTKWSIYAYNGSVV